jgi:hypothetical protein
VIQGEINPSTLHPTPYTLNTTGGRQVEDQIAAVELTLAVDEEIALEMVA